MSVRSENENKLFNLVSQYSLEKYSGSKSRFKCPNCGKQKQFTRYINIDSQQYLNEWVGICNRIDKCSYHYPPNSYFKDNPAAIKNQQTVEINSNSLLKQVKNKVSEISNYSFDCIPDILFIKSLTKYCKNNFINGLIQLFGDSITKNLIELYKLGTAKQPERGTIFWQIDTEGRVRTGKILVYGVKSLKRIKNNSMQNNQQVVYTNVQRVVDWVHSRLKYKKIVKEYNLQQCLFGLHQLTNNSKDKTIGIVESEKTAVIASVYMPNLIWMATGGAQNLNVRLLQPLIGRKVILFPDVNQFGAWKKKAKYIKQQLVDEYQQGIDITVSNLLERRATPKMKEHGADLADILIKKCPKTKLAINDLGYPVMWDL